MSNEFVRFGFVTGELSPNLVGRSDLEKFDLGLSLAYNFVVDYRGGITTRPGSQFGEYIIFDNHPAKFFKFVFSPDTANTYVVLFGHKYIRFIQDNAYVLQAAKTITGITQAAEGVITSAAHGYANGDWVYPASVGGMTELNGKLLLVADQTTNTYKITDVFGTYINTSGFGAFTSGGITRRVYTVASPYSGEDLALLRADQIRDTLRLTHPDYPIYELVRTAHTSWTMGESEFGNDVPAPTGVVCTPSSLASSPPGSSCGYVVTAVDDEGNESVASKMGFITGAHDMTALFATYQVEWDTQLDVAYYKVYRTVVRTEAAGEIGQAAEVGYVGRSYGTNFFDQNVIPDFTHTPPHNTRPFADGRVKRINVLTSNSDYTNNSVVAITSATGSGFVGFSIVQVDFDNAVGPLVGIQVVDPGHDYRSTDTVTVSIGTGGTFELVVDELVGNNPRVSATFQQRQVYAGTDNDPETVWGSQPGKFRNFDVSPIVKDDDSYEHEIDASVVSPIKHLTPTRGGLLVWSQTGIWILNGENGAALTPKNPLADPQSYIGVSDVPPVRIGTDVLYVESVGSTARLLSYKDANKVYNGEDISILSSHFFRPDNIVTAFGYSASPSKVVWAPRTDGSMLAFTVLREQNIYAWTQCWTRGEYQDVIVVNENLRDATYVMVERVLNHKSVKMFERLAAQEFRYAEDAWCVDCGLSLPANHPNGQIKFDAASGVDVVATASQLVFNPTDVGRIIRAAGGKAVVTAYLHARQVRVDWQRDAVDLVPFSEPPTPRPTLAWTMDTPVTEVSGLDHLEGETVVGLQDGNVFSDVVLNGRITGMKDATRVIVGLKFVCMAKTLPLTATDQPIEARRKRSVGAVINRLQTRGIEVGTDFIHMYPMKERQNEVMGEAIVLQDGSKYIHVGPMSWDIEAAICIRQSEPLPATIRAMVLDVEVGDDPD